MSKWGAGIRTATLITRRDWNPRIRLKIRPLQANSNQMLYLGWKNSIIQIDQAAFLKNESGILIVGKPGVKNYQIYRSNENEDVYQPYDTGVVFDTARTIEILVDKVFKEFLIRVDDKRIESFSDHIPELSTGLAFHLQIFKTVHDTDTKCELHLFKARLTQDKG